MEKYVRICEGSIVVEAGGASSLVMAFRKRSRVTIFLHCSSFALAALLLLFTLTTASNSFSACNKMRRRDPTDYSQGHTQSISYVLRANLFIFPEANVGRPFAVVGLDILWVDFDSIVRV